MVRRLALFALVLLGACGRLIPAGNQQTEPLELRVGAFELDPNHATLLWKIDHLGFSTFVGRFDDFDASLDFTPEDPAASRLEVIVQTTSIDSGLPAMDETLRGSGWFDTERFPEARFVATGIDVTGDTTGEITGDLTLLGVTRPVTLDVTFNGGATEFITGRYTLGFAAEGAFERSEFGMNNLVPAIGDQVQLEIHVEFLARESD